MIARLLSTPHRASVYYFMVLIVGRYSLPLMSYKRQRKSSPAFSRSDQNRNDVVWFTCSIGTLSKSINREITNIMSLYTRRCSMTVSVGLMANGCRTFPKVHLVNQLVKPLAYYMCPNEKNREVLGSSENE